MISVIIPTYNESNCIAKTLDQFLCISKPIEIVVSDGGSTDGTRGIVRQWIEQHHCSYRVSLVLAPPGGRGPTLQAGAEAATGDILIFLHADTILPRKWRTCIYEALTQPEVIGGAFKLGFDDPNWYYRGVALYANLRAKLFQMYHGDQAMFLWARAHRRLGGFANVPLMEDVMLSEKMRVLGKTVQLSAAVITSTRRIAHYGRCKSVFRYFKMKLLYHLGVSPQTLTRIYLK